MKSRSSIFSIFKTSSSDQTRGFYERLAKGDGRQGIWGQASRFNPDSIAQKPSVHTHFVPEVSKYLDQTDKCLDLGCGPGGFLSLMAPLCKQIIGADIVPAFVEQCSNIIHRSGLENASAVLLDKPTLPFENDEFDKVILVDTVHHLEFPQQTISEVFRVLKPGGLVIIFEPNKLNPLLALLCALDSNEHGLLRLGTFSAYRRLVESSARVICESYNGMLVGPQNNAAIALADFVSAPHRRNVFGWLSPKIFLVVRKS